MLNLPIYGAICSVFLLLFPGLENSVVLPLCIGSLGTGIYLHLRGYQNDWQKLKNLTAIGLSFALFILTWGKSWITLSLLSRIIEKI